MKKRKYIFLTFLLVMLSFLTWFRTDEASAFSGGTGTPTDPYKISSVAEFLQIR